MQMEKLTPANRSVPRADGLKTGAANTVLTTPEETFGKYTSGYNEGTNAINDGHIFGKEAKH